MRRETRHDFRRVLFVAFSSTTTDRRRPLSTLHLQHTHANPPPTSTSRTTSVSSQTKAERAHRQRFDPTTGVSNKSQNGEGSPGGHKPPNAGVGTPHGSEGTMPRNTQHRRREAPDWRGQPRRSRNTQRRGKDIPRRGEQPTTSGNAQHRSWETPRRRGQPRRSRTTQRRDKDTPRRGGQPTTSGNAQHRSWEAPRRREMPNAGVGTPLTTRAAHHVAERPTQWLGSLRMARAAHDVTRVWDTRRHNGAEPPGGSAPNFIPFYNVPRRSAGEIIYYYNKLTPPLYL